MSAHISEKSFEHPVVLELLLGLLSLFLDQHKVRTVYGLHSTEIYADSLGGPCRVALHDALPVFATDVVQNAKR